MSFTVFLGKFSNGEPVDIEVQKLLKVISKYGRIEEGSLGMEFVSNNTELFENADFSKSDSSLFCIHRPSNHPELKNLIFDFLSIKGTCYFSQDLDFIKIRNAKENDFPEDMVQHCRTGLTIVKSFTEI
ncbi:hypothetical protein [Dokdonia sp. Asnod1-B02]|uniref:hypothetical protein n=1 Tax=Dokdonia sp. Asnod1-B02 TaxID=3160573 RepID=UPI0038672FD3